MKHINSNMRQSKYLCSDYWRKKIIENEIFWNGMFENQPISRESVIISPVILNSIRNQTEVGWAVYPDVKSVLGFLKFIYLPTAFIGLIEGETEYEYYIQDNMDKVFLVLKIKFPDKINLINKTEDFYYRLEKLWQEEDDVSCLEALKSWCQDFNQNWGGVETKGITLSFNVFDSPKEVADFIVTTYEEGLGIDFFEWEIGMKKDEFLQMCSQEIYGNEFMNRKFADFLTNRLNFAF